MILNVSDVSNQITWYKNNSLIHPRPEFKQTYGDGVATLELRDIFPEDAGKFVCVAKNEAGEAKSTCTVRVKGKEISPTSNSND